MFTIIRMAYGQPKRAIGAFKTRDEARAWAKADGWRVGEYLIIEISL